MQATCSLLIAIILCFFMQGISWTLARSAFSQIWMWQPGIDFAQGVSTGSSDYCGNRFQVRPSGRQANINYCTGSFLSREQVLFKDDLCRTNHWHRETFVCSDWIWFVVIGWLRTNYLYILYIYICFHKGLRDFQKRHWQVACYCWLSNVPMSAGRCQSLLGNDGFGDGVWSDPPFSFCLVFGCRLLTSFHCPKSWVQWAGRPRSTKAQQLIKYSKAVEGERVVACAVCLPFSGH